MEQTTEYEAFGELKADNGFISCFARKKGRMHTANATPCQDFCLVKNIGADAQAAAVADGHGGEAYVKSDVGSRIACELLCELAEERGRDGGEKWTEYFLTSDFRRGFLSEWRERVLRDYKENEAPDGESDGAIVRKYGSTLLFAIRTETRTVVGQLGDGAILLFDGHGRSQLFKRHGVKLGSATSSLVSNRAEYSFFTEGFDSRCFPCILLSSDGIYDRLDTGDAFSIYGRYLVEQTEAEGTLQRPFHLDGSTDVSEITRDDCSIVLMKSPADSSPAPEAELPCGNAAFCRITDGLEIFTGEHGEVLHLTREPSEVSVESPELFNVIAPSEKQSIGDRTLYIYPDAKGQRSVKALLEAEMHLEKRYAFNDTGEDGTAAPYGNLCWLRFYEKLPRIREELDALGVSLRPYAFESSLLSADGTLSFYADAFGKKTDAPDPTERIADYFSILGKLRCGQTELPLFKCVTQGQNIDMLHGDAKRSLCRVIFNPEKQIYGLWNASGLTWSLVDEKRQSVPPQGVLRLNRDHTLRIPWEGAADGYAEYEIVLF